MDILSHDSDEGAPSRNGHRHGHSTLQKPLVDISIAQGLAGPATATRSTHYQGPLHTPAELARKHGLKRHIVKGQTEWHGPNPSGHGAQHDGFILKEAGDSFERNGEHYSTRQTARLFGIEPEQYAPWVEWQERGGRGQSESSKDPYRASRHAGSKASAASTTGPKTQRVKLPKAAFSWEQARLFTYRDEGVILFQVGRCDASGCEKSISQRRPVNPTCTEAENAGGWVYGLGAGVYNPRGADFYPLQKDEQPRPGAREFPEARRVLYHRADVLEAHTVHLCEGEKASDAFNDALAAEGKYGPHVATTNPHGGGTWTGERGESYSADLKGKCVVVHPDNDGPGEKHAATVCASIAPHAAWLQVLHLPELPEKGDVADFLEAGGTAERVLELAQEAPLWMPAPEAWALEAWAPETDSAAAIFGNDFPQLEAQDIAKPSLTGANGKPEYAARQLVDLLRPKWAATALTTHAAHAARIAAHCGARLAYNAGLGWCFYNGRHWRRDDRAASGTVGLVAPLSGAVRAEGGELLRHAGTLATAGRVQDSDALTRAAKQVLKHAAQAEASAFIEGALHLAAHAHAVEVERFDQKPFLLGFQNGTWANGTWREHRCDDYLLHLSPVHLTACNRSEWEQVLERITGGDSQYKRTLRDVVGYILSGASHSRLLPWAYGPRGTGKSTIAELLQTVLGPMATAIDSKYLEDDSQRERLGALIWNKRLAVCAESGKKRLDAELLKMLSGSDTIPVRLLFKEAFDTRPRHVLMMVANDPPRVEAHDDALRERVIALPFVHPLSHPEPLKITGGPRIEAARSDPASPLVRGFAAWAIEGLEHFHKHQEIFRAPVVVDACARFWADADPITPFWETVEIAELTQGNGIPKSELRKRYETWCEGEGLRPVAAQRWSRACQARGFEEPRSNGIRYWRAKPERTAL